MKFSFFSLLIVLIFSMNARGQSEKDFILFNGEDLNGWVGDRQYWQVKDGMIVGKFEEIEHNQFLRSKKTVDDFRLILQVRLVDGQGNSGIQFRSTALACASFFL